MSAYKLILSEAVQKYCSQEEQEAIRRHPEFLKLTALTAECEAQNDLLLIAEKAKEAAWLTWMKAESRGLDREPHQALWAYLEEQNTKKQEKQRNWLRRQVAAVLAGELVEEAEMETEAIFYSDFRYAELEAAARAEIDKRKLAALAEKTAADEANKAYREVEKAREQKDKALDDAWYASPLRKFVTFEVDHW